ncbi:flavin carrier protein 2 [[Candida] railenensis]|uniref:Flavin carrier protein 2 n=1 Tax=[Candida] railenensis TaxID=45579 RepID=A0A9P0VZJ1_9ASCO|nr:flavin carrier protein 2 [[Candida] railenensis]
MLFFDLPFILVCALLTSSVRAVSHITSSSLLTCMDNSQFSASHFEVTYYPHNSSVTFDITAISSINANITANVEVIAYGLNILTKNISLCDLSFDTTSSSVSGLCPFTTGHIELSSSYTLSKSVTSQIPGITFGIPDLDARVRVLLINDDTGESLACVEAILSNGKTVQTKYAAWPIAAISGLGVITSGVVSVIGHSNTAAHIASNSMSLFVYFQSLAITSMMAVAYCPPIAAAWSQNFQWSVGIIKLGFIQKIANWYMQATGGTPTDVLGSTYLSVSVQKRKSKRELTAEFIGNIYEKQLKNNFLTVFDKRASISLDSDTFGYSDNLNSTLYTTNEKDANVSSKILVLRGIQRVAYLAGIEITSLFMTTIIFLIFFGFVMIVFLMLFKAVIEILIRSKMMNEGKFNEYRQQWTIIIKGALYRLLLISFPQVAVLSIWEFTERDSGGTIAIAVFLLLVSVILLYQAAIRVFLMGRKSVKQFRNPAYLLYGDAKFLNRFGFIYVQFRADCYYYVLIALSYIFLKSLFVAVLQKHGRPQSVLIFAVELFYMIGLCWKKPYMDKRTNAFNITISVISTLNALFFMFFSYIFNQPHVVGSVMAVVYFVLNAVFALFLLIFTIVTCVLALIYKNPDTRYQPMKDDRVSFIPRFDNPKGGDKLNSPDGRDDGMELMALGATAMKGHENAQSNNKNYEDDSIFEEDSVYRNHANRFNSNSNSASTDSVLNNRAAGERDSYYESYEPTEPTSTITGNGAGMNPYQNYLGNRNNQYANHNVAFKH